MACHPRECRLSMSMAPVSGQATMTMALAYGLCIEMRPGTPVSTTVGRASCLYQRRMSVTAAASRDVPRRS